MKFLISFATAIAALVMAPTANSACTEFAYPGVFGAGEKQSIYNNCNECKMVRIKAINCHGENSEVVTVQPNSSRKINIRFSPPSTQSSQVQCGWRRWEKSQERPCSTSTSAQRF